MYFYLVRHGEAVSETVDPKRPLTRVGRQDVEQVARLAVARNVRVSAILHSGILRAHQTAEIFAEYLLPAAGVQQISWLLPQDDPWVAKAELETAQSPLMAVGHLPHIGRLASLLAHGDPDRAAVAFGPATLICYSRSSAGWKIQWTLTPQSV